VHFFVTHDIGAAVEVADRVAVMYAGRIVEDNAVAPLIAAPAHPYTAALMAASVGTESRGRTLTTIAGAPTDLGQLIPGCAFAPRCGHASARCMTERPPLTRHADHARACWHPMTEPVAA
jgi:peptide/nickel transport system ATP-binding protein